MQVFVIALAALTVIVVASAFSRRTGLATPLLLVVLGIAGSYLPGVPDIEIDPELVLAGILPPLLYASAVRFPVTDLRRNLRMITWLSVVLVAGSAVVIGFVVNLVFAQIPLGLAVALGAVVSPTDAVAATSVGRRLGLPPRLMSLLEGESLVNDASALVVLRTAIASVGSAFSFAEATGQFAWAVVGAVLVGLVVGAASGWVRGRIDDPVLATTVSFAVPFAAYFPAEELAASGVLAVVVSGIATGVTSAKNTSARTRQTVAINWATISFIGESALFLLMGLQLPGLARSLSDDSVWVVIAGSALVCGLLIVLRALGVAVLLLGERRQPRRRDRAQRRIEAADERLSQFEPQTQAQERKFAVWERRVAQVRADSDYHEQQRLNWRGGVVLGWAGMRGAITVAAAQTIPYELPHRSTVVLIAFNVAVVTLLGFGATLPAVIRAMRFESPTKEAKRAELVELMRSATDTVVARLGPLSEQQVDGEQVDPKLAETISRRLSPLLSGHTLSPLAGRPDAREQVHQLQGRYLDALREAVLDEQSIGAYRTETFTAALALLDREEARLERLE
ncbi:sodium:proton antiporter [Epidermidibacterium keratini]|uniref:Sodium:proton antiporter n=1 Tax=Epidermidibacterium keratini TaxID=1891644 RepID=A0A7L4YP83_9ACTN|nr:sodium:proton antiporter [Epidermidibacterium keratini]QHC00684.1 sodium:proton antiporter [Epidermidibacterium keratini]